MSQSLLLASEKGRLDQVMTLLASGESVEAVDDRKSTLGHTPLMLACRAGYEQVAQVLIEAGADITAISRDATPFSTGERMMLYHTSWDDCETGGMAMGWTALHLAARFGHLPCLALLMKNGADLNRPTAFGSPPLHVAIEAKQVAAAQALIEAGADVNARDHDKSTPLHVAAFWDQPEVVASLAESPKLKIDLKDKDGLTPLHVAITEASRHVLPALISAGADLEKTTRQGATAAELAQEIGGSTRKLFFELTEADAPKMTAQQIETAINHNDLDALRQADSQGVKWNSLADMPEFDGWTPLSIATLHGRPATLQLLIELGCDVNQRNRDRLSGAAEFAGASPLLMTYASQEYGSRKFERRAQPLLDAGADINLPNAFGHSCLMLLARSLNAEWLEQCIQSGADALYQSSFGESARTILEFEWMAVLKHPEFANEKRADYERCVVVLENAGSPNQPDVWYKAHAAMQDGDWPQLRELIDGGLDPNIAAIRPGGDGPESTLLQRVCQNSDIDNPDAKSLVTLMVQKGVDVNQVTVADGRPPVFHSTKNANAELTEMLLKAGAQTTITYKDETLADQLPTRKADREKMRELISQYDPSLTKPKRMVGLMLHDGSYELVLAKAGTKRVANWLANHFADSRSWQPREGLPAIDGIALMAWTDGDSPLPWTSLHALGDYRIRNLDELATMISKELKVATLHVQVSDAAGYEGYDYYRKGTRAERYQSYPADSPSLDGPPVFESTLRKRSLEKADNIDTLLAELDVLVPCFQSIDSLDQLGDWKNLLRQTHVVKIDKKQ
ncbi:ankyrin repeat domain-containing protein [Stieleria mannarensis]|uniref:ankyrin repeat domain-containing protein n=1 Tax=Stieleria mannarensis TaxID=2755585 RepID=UPI001600DACF|nr:ankyrin repeat domain-containing protein [Rhodopirellula sp. JC639]